jgi:5-methylcytosine-specific restriction endonuclease McrA
LSERIAETYVRVEFPTSVRKAAWARCGGRCEQCGKPLVKGGYTYDHTLPARRGGASDLANCKVLCNDGPESCDKIKTFTEDLPGIAAVKRYGKNRLPLDVDRPDKRPPKMRGPGFRKGGPKQKIQSRPFQQRRP